jgi:endothelin-converting enzyme
MCLFLADYLLDSIDESVEPCEDFYQFACGTWLKNSRIPDDGKYYMILWIILLNYSSKCTKYISNSR